MRYGFMRHASPLVRWIRPAAHILRAPISRDYGFDRGTPIDRHFIESFLERHRRSIHGCVLEIKNSNYSKRFGTDIEKSDVLDIDDTNTQATVIADLQHAGHIADNQYDCFILTQTLQYVFDLKSAIAHCRRILRPGGVLLVTVPTILLMDPDFVGGEYWRLTGAACEKLFGDEFGPTNIVVETFGNYATTSGALAGMAVEDLESGDFQTFDPQYPLLACVAATKT